MLIMIGVGVKVRKGCGYGYWNEGGLIVIIDLNVVCIVYGILVFSWVCYYVIWVVWGGKIIGVV